MAVFVIHQRDDLFPIQQQRFDFLVGLHFFRQGAFHPSVDQRHRLVGDPGAVENGAAHRLYLDELKFRIPVQHASRAGGGVLAGGEQS